MRSKSPLPQDPSPYLLLSETTATRFLSVLEILYLHMSAWVYVSFLSLTYLRELCKLVLIEVFTLCQQ